MLLKSQFFSIQIYESLKIYHNKEIGETNLTIRSYHIQLSYMGNAITIQTIEE